MSLLIETIRLSDGEFNNLAYHEQRMSDSILSIYKRSNEFDLYKLLSTSSFPRHGLYKCRLTYDDKDSKIEFEPYTIRMVKSLKIVRNNEINYPFKFKDRSRLMEVFEQREGCDDVLIIKDGYVTDTSYANIVFKKKDKWITPSSYLLKGTMRQFLIDKKIIEEQQIRLKDIPAFEKFKLINSMLQWEGPEVDISNIV